MKKYLINLFVLFTILMCCSFTSSAKSENILLLRGESYRIPVQKQITWKSKDSSIAKVNTNGRVKGMGYGKTKIIGTDKKGRKYKYNVTVSNYKVVPTGNRRYPNKVKVQTPTGNKVYRVYNQVGFGNSYLTQRGCSHSSAAMVMSAYGKKYTPMDIHYGSANKKCSERYALKKLNKKVAVTGQSLSVYSISKILRNVGIKNHPVYRFTRREATREIENNLKQGKPILIMCHRKKVNGIKLANSYHFLVLVGIDPDGNAIVLNAAGGTVNTSQCTGKYKLPVKTLVKNHMWSCTGKKYKSFYFNGSENYGGYIVIDE